MRADHLLTGLPRIFHSQEEVHEFARRSTTGAANDKSGAGLEIAAQIVEAVTGTTYWDHVHEHASGAAA